MLRYFSFKVAMTHFLVLHCNLLFMFLFYFKVELLLEDGWMSGAVLRTPGVWLRLIPSAGSWPTNRPAPNNLPTFIEHISSYHPIDWQT